MKGGGYDASSKNNIEALPAGLNLGKDSRTCKKYVCLQFCVCYWGHLPCSKGILLPCCQAPCEPHLVIDDCNGIRPQPHSSAVDGEGQV